MTEKQVVPKYVADWIEYCKDNNFRLLGALAPIGKFGEDLAPDYKGNILKTLAWIKANQDEFAKAWVNGYKVAQPPKCKVLIKGLKKEYNYIKHNTQLDYWYIGSNMAGASFNLWHTKDELEEAGFGWVFSCEGVVVVEV